MLLTLSDRARAISAIQQELDQIQKEKDAVKKEIENLSRVNLTLEAQEEALTHALNTLIQ